MAKIPRFFASANVASGSVGVSIDPGLTGSLTKTGLEGVGFQELGRELEVTGRAISDRHEREQALKAQEAAREQQQIAKEHKRTQEELKRKTAKAADNSYVVNNFAQFKLDSFRELAKRKDDAGFSTENFLI